MGDSAAWRRAGRAGRSGGAEAREGFGGGEADVEVFVGQGGGEGGYGRGGVGAVVAEGAGGLGADGGARVAQGAGEGGDGAFGAGADVPGAERAATVWQGFSDNVPSDEPGGRLMLTNRAQLQSLIICLGASTTLLGQMDAVLPEPLVCYRFDGSFKNAGARQARFEGRRVELRAGSLYLNGRYEFDFTTATEAIGQYAECRR